MSFETVAQDLGQARANVQEYLDNKASGVLRPAGAKGISGFVFDIPLRDNIELSADITDHYTESGSFISDHVVLKPARITLQGLVGELVALTGIAEKVIQDINNKLETVEAYLGDYTPGMVQLLQQALTAGEMSLDVLNEKVSRIGNVVDMFAGESPEKTRQEQYFTQLEALYKAKTVVTVQTPWKFYESMIIESISVVQDEQTAEISDISVSLKEIRFAEVEFVNFDGTLIPVREEIQSSAEQDAGTVTGVRNSFIFDVASEAGVVQ